MGITNSAGCSLDSPERNVFMSYCAIIRHLRLELLLDHHLCLPCCNSYLYYSKAVVVLRGYVWNLPSGMTICNDRYYGLVSISSTFSRGNITVKGLIHVPESKVRSLFNNKQTSPLSITGIYYLYS